jgi:transcriptional regulator with GAF, ATPase, and Fis domain
MSTNAIIASESASDRYEAVVRISEALAAASEPEALAETLANELEEFLYFDHLYIAVLKENSKEIEYRVRGKGDVALPDLPMEELPIWEAIASPDPVRVVDWLGAQRSPRFKEWVKQIGFGSGISIPMSTPHRRLGTLGIARDKLDPFGDEDMGFLRVIARVVAFALDDGASLLATSARPSAVALESD